VSATQVEPMYLIGDVEGKDVLIVDDMTETAGTLCAAAKILAQNGAKRIFAGVSHATLTTSGREKLRDSAIEQLLTTNSTPVEEGKKVKPLSVAEFFGEAIRRIDQGESVTTLFEI